MPFQPQIPEALAAENKAITAELEEVRTKLNAARAATAAARERVTSTEAAFGDGRAPMATVRQVREALEEAELRERMIDKVMIAAEAKCRDVGTRVQQETAAQAAAYGSPEAYRARLEPLFESFAQVLRDLDVLAIGLEDARRDRDAALRLAGPGNGFASATYHLDELSRYLAAVCQAEQIPPATHERLNPNRAMAGSLLPSLNGRQVGDPRPVA